MAFDTLSIVLIIFAIILGFLIGRHITEKRKWDDKKKLIEEQWRSKLELSEKEQKMQLMKVSKEKELEINKLSNEWKLENKKLSSEWEVKYSTELAEIKELIQGAEKYMRKDAVTRSRRTLLGKLWEQVSPYIPKFPFKPSDMKFLGAPIDFVIFDGMGEKDIKRVIFLEVKSGNSKLSSQERKLKEVIEKKKVTWKLFNVDKPGKIKIEEIEKEEVEEDEVKPNELYRHIDEKISSVTKSGSKDSEDEKKES